MNSPDINSDYAGEDDNEDLFQDAMESPLPQEVTPSRDQLLRASSTSKTLPGQTTTSMSTTPNLSGYNDDADEEDDDDDDADDDFGNSNYNNPEDSNNNELDMMNTEEGMDEEEEDDYDNENESDNENENENENDIDNENDNENENENENTNGDENENENENMAGNHNKDKTAEDSAHFGLDSGDNIGDKGIDTVGAAINNKSTKSGSSPAVGNKDNTMEDFESEVLINNENQKEQERESGNQQDDTDLDGDVKMEEDLDEIKEQTSEGYDKQQTRVKLAPGTETARTYDMVPYVAALHSTSIHCLDFTKGLKWMFTGGQDGFIRRYDFFASVTGKLPLTVAQRHPFVDSVTRSGVLASYWENEQPLFEEDVKLGKDGLYEPKLSPVYSLAVQSEALWLLSGLESGGITLQTIRHSEGQIQAYLDGHTSAVSCLKLDQDETRAISGGWDKRLLEWDLNTGKIVKEYQGSTGQITNLEWQPVGGSLVSSTLGKESIYGKKIKRIPPPGVNRNSKGEPEQEGGADEEDDGDDKSLGSLFGDDDEDQEQGSDSFKEKDDVDAVIEETIMEDEKELDNTSTEPGKNEVSHSIFLTGSIDGAVTIWDRRQASKAGQLVVTDGTPPWCTSSCWSPDGSMIFVGRRNAMVEEYDIRSSLTQSARQFKFPGVSGPVSTVAALPNGRHLLCGSNDNVRLYDLQASESKNATPFLIIPGHHGGVLSSIYIDPSCRFMVTASGSRGWSGVSTEVALVYEITPFQ